MLTPLGSLAFFGGFGRRQQQQKKAPSVSLDLQVTLKDLYMGTQIEVRWFRFSLLRGGKGRRRKDRALVQGSNLHPLCPMGR